MGGGFPKGGICYEHVFLINILTVRNSSKNSHQDKKRYHLVCQCAGVNDGGRFNTDYKDTLQHKCEAIEIILP